MAMHDTMYTASSRDHRGQTALVRATGQCKHKSAKETSNEKKILPHQGRSRSRPVPCSQKATKKVVQD
eukprot:scaffold254696_cov15-Prasinocladus_malaysianus.AAC.1